jgi:hypothetical protein
LTIITTNDPSSLIRHLRFADQNSVRNFCHLNRFGYL